MINILININSHQWEWQMKWFKHQLEQSWTVSQISQYHSDFINLNMINRQKSTLQRLKNVLRAKKSFQRKEKTLAPRKVWKCYNCEKFRHLSQQCKKSCNDEKKTVTATSHNSFNWTACQNNMCKIYMNNKDEVRWYSQKWQKRHELYNTIKMPTKEIATLDWIDVEEINTHDIQEENFPEYNKKVYIFKNYEFNKEIIRQKKVWKEAVKQIEIITKKVINIVWKSQKSEPSTKLYDFRWTLAKNDIQDTVLWKEELWTIKLWKVIQETHQKKREMLLIDMQMIQSQVDFHNLEDMIKNEAQKKEHKKTEIRCDFSEGIKEILQHNQLKYKIMLCIFLERKKIIY